MSCVCVCGGGGGGGWGVYAMRVSSIPGAECARSLSSHLHSSTRNVLLVLNCAKFVPAAFRASLTCKEKKQALVRNRRHVLNHTFSPTR